MPIKSLPWRWYNATNRTKLVFLLALGTSYSNIGGPQVWVRDQLGLVPITPTLGAGDYRYHVALWLTGASNVRVGCCDLCGCLPSLACFTLLFLCRRHMLFWLRAGVLNALCSISFWKSVFSPPHVLICVQEMTQGQIPVVIDGLDLQKRYWITFSICIYGPL